MNDEPAFDPDPILAALSDEGVRYVIVGGLAVAAHGVIRANRVVGGNEPSINQ